MEGGAQGFVCVGLCVFVCVWLKSEVKNAPVEFVQWLMYRERRVHFVAFVPTPGLEPLRAICTVLLDPRDPSLQSERTQGFTAGPVDGRAKCLPMLGAFKT